MAAAYKESIWTLLSKDIIVVIFDTYGDFYIWYLFVYVLLWVLGLSEGWQDYAW